MGGSCRWVLAPGQVNANESRVLSLARDVISRGGVWERWRQRRGQSGSLVVVATLGDSDAVREIVARRGGAADNLERQLRGTGLGRD